MNKPIRKIIKLEIWDCGKSNHRHKKRIYAERCIARQKPKCEEWAKICNKAALRAIVYTMLMELDCKFVKKDVSSYFGVCYGTLKSHTDSYMNSQYSSNLMSHAGLHWFHGGDNSWYHKIRSDLYCLPNRQTLMSMLNHPIYSHLKPDAYSLLETVIKDLCINVNQDDISKLKSDIDSGYEIMIQKPL